MGVWDGGIQGLWPHCAPFAIDLKWGLHYL